MKGPSFGRRFLGYAAYTAFFGFTLVLFVYLTLPLDTVKAYLVRKFADEYGADLAIEDLSTWGVLGVEAENVTLTFRPTPEEESAMEAAAEARKAWQAEHGKNGDADKGDKADKTAKAEGADKPAKVEGSEAAGGAPGAAPKAAASDGAEKSEYGEKAEKPTAPPAVVGPQPIEIGALRVRLGLLGLLKGSLTAIVKGELAGGTLEAEVTKASDGLHAVGNWDTLDLRELSFLRRKLGVPVTGLLSGDLDVDVPSTDEGKLRMSSAQGHIALKLAEASLGPGKVPGKSIGFDTVDVPQVRIQGIDGKLVLDKKRATVDHFDIVGKDLEGELTGYIELKDAFARMAPRLHIRFKLGDEFLEAHKDVKVLMSSVPKLKSAQADGYTGLMINGSFSAPTVTPKRESPYKAGGSAKAEAGDARTKPAGGKERKPKAPGRTPGVAAARQTAIPVAPPMVVPRPAAPATAEAVAEPTAPETEAPAPETEAPAPEPEAPAPETAPENPENPEAPATTGEE